MADRRVFQAVIDGVPAGRTEARDEQDAVRQFDAWYDGMPVDGDHLTREGETITVKELSPDDPLYKLIVKGDA